MEGMRLGTVVVAVLAIRAISAQTPQTDLKSLYEAGKWTALYTSAQAAKGNGNGLYSGAVAVVFNRDHRHAEAALRSVIKAAPRSQEAYEAYEWLIHLYLKAGQYQRLTKTVDEREAAFPQEAGREQEQATFAAYRGLPDQALETSRHSVLSHERDSIFMPLTVNGTRAEYFFDTGAGMSGISESEATRLGLKINETAATMGTTTSPITFRTAVAKNVVVGGFHFKNVSFAVLPEREPWTFLEPGKRGIIGLPLLVGFRTLRWYADGQLEIGGKSGPFDVAKSNMYFDDDHVVIESTVQQQRVLATLDTGAENTDLFAAFADQFASLLKEMGKKDSFDLQGVGGTETLEAVRLPDLKFTIGGRETVLSPARVLVHKSWRKCCGVNVGLDLLKQADSFTIDFGSMTLLLTGRP
jgi:predicted aspartyl protease